MSDLLTAEDAGCFLDGVFGWHNNYRVIDLAMHYGWVPDDGFPAVSRIRDAYEDGEDYVNDGKIDVSGAMSDQGGYVDQATDYLNSVAPPGYYFEWDGDLNLVADEDYDPDLYDCNDSGHIPNVGEKKCIMCDAHLKCSLFRKLCIRVWVSYVNFMSDFFEWSEESKRKLEELKTELKSQRESKSDPS